MGLFRGWPLFDHFSKFRCCFETKNEEISCASDFGHFSHNDGISSVPPRLSYWATRITIHDLVSCHPSDTGLHLNMTFLLKSSWPKDYRKERWPTVTVLSNTTKLLISYNRIILPLFGPGEGAGSSSRLAESRSLLKKVWQITP